MNGNEFEYFLDNLSLSTLLVKSSFAFLLLSMLLYWFQASFQSNRETESSFAVLNSRNAQCNQYITDVKKEDTSSEMLEVRRWKNEYKKDNISWMHSFFRKAPSLAMGLANIALALMLLIRWVESGHFPLSNLYESLLFLSWSLTSIHFYLERAFLKGGLLLPTLGAITAPLALFTNAFATFSLPQEMQKVSVLVPALQSNWLIMHVSVMMVSYAALLSGSLLAMAFLVVKFFSDISGSKHVISDFHPRGYNMSTPSSSPLFLNSPNELGDRKLPLCSEQESGPILSLSAKLASSLHPSAVSFQSKIGQHQVNGTENMEFTSDSAVSLSSLPLGLGGQYIKDVKKEDSEKHNGQNLLMTNVGLNISKSEETFEEKLKQTLDNLSYRSIGLGFALLTIGIFSGAVWANEAWGSYWSWDPKETWAFITWLVFALYLHTRLSRGWVGKESALVATFGFLIIWFCYLGVNLFGKGLHSYGWFPAN